MGPRRRWRARTATAPLVATAMAVLVAAGACSDGDDGDRAQPTLTTPSTTATTAAPSTTTTEAEPERVEAEPPPGEPRPDIDVNVTYPADFDDEQIEVVEAYRGFWHAAYLMNDPCGPTQVGEAARCPPDPDHPLIARYATGPPLATIRSNAERRQSASEVTTIPPDADYAHLISEVSINGDQAVLMACSIDDAVVLDAQGEVIDDRRVVDLYRAVLTRADGLWKVSADVEPVGASEDESERCDSEV